MSIWDYKICPWAVCIFLESSARYNFETRRMKAKKVVFGWIPRHILGGPRGVIFAQKLSFPKICECILYEPFNHLETLEVNSLCSRADIDAWGIFVTQSWARLLQIEKSGLKIATTPGQKGGSLSLYTLKLSLCKCNLYPIRLNLLLPLSFPMSEVSFIKKILG